MKTKVLLFLRRNLNRRLDLVTRRVIKQTSKRTKLATTGLFLLPVVQVFYLVTRTVKPILKIV